jgi:hypothetical protein
MNTRPVDEVDARFLGGIGMVLVAATVVTGIVLISSLPRGQNSMLMETSLPVAVVTVDMQPVFSSYDLPHFSSNSRSLSGERVKWGANLFD